MKKKGPNKRYTAELKIQVAETVLKERISLKEAVRRFELSGPEAVKRWLRIYREEGPAALYEERRGRRKGIREEPIRPLPRQDINEATRSDLVQEVKWLRAENDYLKKLRALVLEEERQNKGQKSSQN